jgi:hypothetical protein
MEKAGIDVSFTISHYQDLLLLLGKRCADCHAVKNILAFAMYQSPSKHRNEIQMQWTDYSNMLTQNYAVL